MSLISNTADGLSPLAAYEQLMHFAKRRGEFALRLAMHAAVPQGIQPELLHLLKRNFVPEAGDDPALEADILFSTLCEELGRGYFRFDPQVRALLLENLVANYSGEAESRISKVADFILAYVDHYDRSTSGSQDQLWRDYLEMQRWVAFAFVDPSSAAQQLAAALESANSSGDFVARIQLGGLASALAAPLAGFPSLLNYAAGLQALELGDRQRADEFFETLHEGELKIGNTTLRSTSQILAEWQARHPDDVPPTKAEERPPSKGFEQTIRALQSKDKDVRRFAAQSLGTIYGSEAAVPALIEVLADSNVAVRLAAVDSLARIGSENALVGLTRALANRSAVVAAKALSWLKEIRQPLALIIGDFTGRPDVLSTIRRTLIDDGYIPVFNSFTISDRRFFQIVSAVKFVIMDVNDSKIFGLDLPRISGLRIPVHAIAAADAKIPSMFLYMQKQYPSLKNLVTYFDLGGLELMLRKWVHELSSPKPQPAKDYKYDVFISYAEADNTPLTRRGRGVVDDLHRSLEQALLEFLGREPRIFRSTELGFERWDVQLDQAIHDSAVFVLVISPAYFNSNSCMREFARIASLEDDLELLSSRIFKVLARPVALKRQPAALQELVGYEFFGFGNQKKFLQTLDRLANDIALTREAQLNRLVFDRTELSSASKPAAEASATVDVLILSDQEDKEFQAQISGSVHTLQGEGLIRNVRSITVPRRLVSTNAEIEQWLNTSNLILFVLSPDFLASEFPWQSHMKRITERFEAGEALVATIIARPVELKSSLYRKFKALPFSAKPITSWADSNQAYREIEKGIRKAVEDLKARQRANFPTEDKPQLERWPVRTGTDEDVGKVSSNTVITTVEELIAIQRPAHMPYVGAGRSKYHSHRSEPVETTRWSLHTTILAYRRTENESYRLILQGQSGATMMAQVPDPNAVDPSSPWIDMFRGVREKLDELDFGNGYSYLDPPMPVRVVGVGHFGRFHSKTRAAKNGIALEPILGIHWLSDDVPAQSEKQTTRSRNKRAAKKAKKLKRR